jgi:predicted negative regulator of RcsB-dependent stress response
VDLLSENEQWEALKRWIRTNGLSIVGMVAVALLAVFAWKWWQAHEDQQALGANGIYDRILTSFDANKTDEAIATIEVLRSEYPKSPYVAAADLAAARVFVGRNELDKAAQRLERVANEASDKEVRPIARLRLVRVLVAQGQYDKALTTLGTTDMGPHQAAYLEVHGDILLAKGDKAGALKQYEAARKLTPDAANVEGVGQLLDLKIGDLRSSISEAAPKAAAP